MHIRVHILPAAAAPTASLFALRHSAGHLLRDGDGKVILCATAEDAERERRRNSASAPVSYIVALVAESDVREVDAVERLAEVLVRRWAPSVETPTGGDVQSEEPSIPTGSTMKIGDVELPVVPNTAGQWSDTPGVTEIPPISIALDPGVQEALAAKPPRKGRRP